MYRYNMINLEIIYNILLVDYIFVNIGLILLK